MVRPLDPPRAGVGTGSLGRGSADGAAVDAPVGAGDIRRVAGSESSLQPLIIAANASAKPTITANLISCEGSPE